MAFRVPRTSTDYAVLTVTAFGSNEQELISGAKVLARPDRDLEDEAGLLTSYVGSVPVSKEHWHQVVISWNEQRLKIFVDGALDLDAEQRGPIPTGTGFCHIGKSDAFSALFAKLRIWARAIGGDQVATMWNNGKGWGESTNEPILSFNVKVSLESRRADSEIVLSDRVRSDERNPGRPALCCPAESGAVVADANPAELETDSGRASGFPLRRIPVARERRIVG